MNRPGSHPNVLSWEGLRDAETENRVPPAALQRTRQTKPLTVVGEASTQARCASLKRFATKRIRRGPKPRPCRPPTSSRSVPRICTSGKRVQQQEFGEAKRLLSIIEISSGPRGRSTRRGPTLSGRDHSRPVQNLVDQTAQAVANDRLGGIRHRRISSTTTASTSTVATSHPSIWRLPTTLNTRDRPPAEFSHHEVSGLARGRFR